MHVLLVEPNYYTKYPPLGLLKLATYFKNDGNSVELVRGCVPPIRKADSVYVTSLFTYAWRPVHDAVRYYRALYPKARITLGGIYASLMPDHAKECEPDEIHTGIVPEVEGLLPDYSLVSVLPWRWKNKSILFASRGCIRKCRFCAVPQLEGGLYQTIDSVETVIGRNHDTVIFWDNNFLAIPRWRDLLHQLQSLRYARNGSTFPLRVDFNQGLDSRMITETDVADELRRTRVSPIRLAYDSQKQRRALGKAIKLLKEVGFNGRKIFVYCLYNYKDDPQDFWKRVCDLMDWGVTVYPMRFEPLDSLEKNAYISPKWTKRLLDMVSQAQRVIGDNGSFTPFDAMKRKLTEARDFEEAFSLRPEKKKEPNGRQLELNWKN